ncbi:hypothetical protein KUCAC02_017917 [Chaenocephalus aceratus]|uniref:Uncharacterized protein n=1 Tax=Chaenocephalus aceratus TaxID=36190 RepID=A0ACB9W8F9_CHAAC|nr:hypothetical protein KUCAC02_017917 [Chaenocephalus aceratus]
MVADLAKVKKNETKVLENDKDSKLRPKKSWIWNQFFVLEEHIGPEPQYVGKTLLKENLELPLSSDLKIERAHRALGTKPPADAPPRSIVVTFARHRTKEEIIKTAWQKRGFVYQERKVNLDHDYSPEVLKKRKEYVEETI